MLAWTWPAVRVRTRRCLLFFFNDTATTEIYTLSLHDALPISSSLPGFARRSWAPSTWRIRVWFRKFWLATVSAPATQDRKSTRLNSSHSQISYAVLCLKPNTEAIGPNAASGHAYDITPGVLLH